MLSRAAETEAEEEEDRMMVRVVKRKGRMLAVVMMGFIVVDVRG